MARSWKPGLVLLAAGCLGVIALSFWFISLRNRNWARLEARVEELRTEVQRTPPLPRLALGRTTLPGNAWDDYLEAWPDAGPRPAPGEGAPMRDFLERKRGVDRAKVLSRLSKDADRIELLRSAVRRQEARLPQTKLTVNGLEVAGISPSMNPQGLAQSAVAQARLLREEGKTAEALDLLTEVCLAGRDWSGARLFQVDNGLQAMDAAFCEIRDFLQSPASPGTELRNLERAMALLDEGFPDTTGQLWDELLKLGELLIREDLYDDTLETFSDKIRVRRTWRFGFSTRLQAAAQFSAAEDLVRREVEIERLPWSEGYQANQDLFREQDRSPDPLIAHGFHRLLGVHSVIRTRGALRLIRAAVHYRATGQVLELEDPVKGSIRSRPSDGGILLWRQPIFPQGNWEPKSGDGSYWYWNSIDVRKR